MAEGMTPEERESAKAALRAQIAHYNEIKEELEDCRTNLRSTNHAIFEGVSRPMIGYDLSGDNEWRGHYYDVEKSVLEESIRPTVKFYRDQVTTVVGQIGTAIKDLEDYISELEASLAALG